jgi:protease-4
MKVIPINGPVLKYGGACTFGMVDYARELAMADADPNIVGTVLDIDTPGGEAGGMTILHDAIRAAKKPVVAIVQSGMAASAGMGIAAACDAVFASRETDKFGSIGMFCTLPDMRKFWETQGLVLHEVYASQSTEKNKEFLEALKADPHDPDDPHYALLREHHINPFVDSFIRMVVKARPAMAATKEQWAKGQLLNAKDALKAGLIDGFNTLPGAIAHAMRLSKTKNKAGTNAASKANPQSTQTMNIKEIAAGFLAGVKNYFASDEEVNEQTLAAANAALKADGFTTLQVISTERLAAVEAAEQNIADAEAKLSASKDDTAKAEAALTAITEEKAKAEAALAEKNTEAETAAAKVAELNGKLEAALAAAKTEVEQHTKLLAERDALIATLKNEPANDGQPSKPINTTGDDDPSGAQAGSEESRQFYKDMNKMVSEF